MRFVASDAEAYDRFYNIFANPMLWFIQHYLWDLSNAPDIRRHEVEAFEFGYNVVNEDLAEAVVEEIDGQDEPVVMVHDYHLYTLPAMVRRARPDVFLHHFIHIPWTQPDAWRVLPGKIRDEIYGACWPTTSSASTRGPTRQLPPVQLGEVIRAAGIGEVVESRCDAFAVGDVVTTLTGFQEYVMVRDDMFSTPVAPGR